MKARGGGFTTVAASIGIDVPLTPHQFGEAARPGWHPAECGCTRCWPDPTPARPTPVAPAASGPEAAPAQAIQATTGQRPQQATTRVEAGPVRCGVCGLVVTTAYTARTARTVHGPCLVDPGRMSQLRKGRARPGRTAGRPDNLRATAGRRERAGRVLAVAS